MTDKVLNMSFSKIYSLYVAKAERKNRTRQEVDSIIMWLTGYGNEDLLRHTESDITLEQFFSLAPMMNPDRFLITGTVCGIRVENIEDKTLRDIRYLDKLIDELAKGRPMEKILRSGKSDN